MAKTMKGGMGVCYDGMCSRCHAGKLLLLGILVLANSIWAVLGWDIFIGALLIIGGLVKLVKPSCPHCM